MNEPCPVLPLRKPRAVAKPAPLKLAVIQSGDLADLQRLTIEEVCALVGRRPSSLREMVKAGRFPEPDHRDGPRCVRWSAGLVRRWLTSTTTAQVAA